MVGVTVTPEKHLDMHKTAAHLMCCLVLPLECLHEPIKCNVMMRWTAVNGEGTENRVEGSLPLTSYGLDSDKVP